MRPSRVAHPPGSTERSSRPEDQTRLSRPEPFLHQNREALKRLHHSAAAGGRNFKPDWIVCVTKEQQQHALAQEAGVRLPDRFRAPSAEDVHRRREVSRSHGYQVLREAHQYPAYAPAALPGRREPEQPFQPAPVEARAEASRQEVVEKSKQRAGRSAPRDYFERLSSRLKAKFGEMLLFIAEEEQAIENQR